MKRESLAGEKKKIASSLACCLCLNAFAGWHLAIQVLSFFLSFGYRGRFATRSQKQTEGKISATPVLQADQRETAEAFLKTLDNLRCYQ